MNLLERHRIDDLVVVDDNKSPVGIVDSQDLTRLKLLMTECRASERNVTTRCARPSRLISQLKPRNSALTLTFQRFNVPMAAANDLRKGMAIKYNGNPAIVLEVHHRTPGNLRAFVQAIIRYINTGKSADVRFGSTDKVELVDIERKTLEFSYKDHNGYHFMDPETYDTITLQEDLIGDAKDYLVENLSVQVLYAEGKAVQVELPASVGLKVIESPEGLRGDTASNVTKPALLETGKTSTSRCSLRKAKRSRSIPAPAPTWAAPNSFLSFRANTPVRLGPRNLSLFLRKYLEIPRLHST